MICLILSLLEFLEITAHADGEEGDVTLSRDAFIDEARIDNLLIF